jgi:hypothetical protein
MNRVLQTAAMVLLVAVVAEHAHHAWRVVTFPIDLDNGEGYVLNQAVLLARGESPWRSIHEEPFIVSNFAPLYPSAVALSVRVGGVSFVFGRALSALATLATALALLLIVRRIHGAWFAPAVAGLLFLSSKFVYDWTSLHRVDALAMALAAWGLYVALRAQRKETAAVLFALALLTRQTMVFAPLAAAVWLFLEGRRAVAIRLAALSFGIPAAVFAALNAATGGEFLRHTVAYNVQPYSWSLVRTFAEHWIWFHPSFLAIALFFAAWNLAERRRGLPVIYVALGVVSFFLCGRVGAASNYMFELVAGLALAAGCVLAELGRSAGPGFQSARCMVLASLVVQALVSHLAFQSPEVAPTPDDDDVRRARQLADLVSGTEGEGLAEDAGVLLLGGKDVLFEPYMMTRLAASGVWDPAPILRDLASGRFSVVVLTFDVGGTRSVRLDARIADAIRRRYREVRRIAGPGGGDRTPSPWWNYWVYAPIPSREAR